STSIASLHLRVIGWRRVVSSLLSVLPRTGATIRGSDSRRLVRLDSGLGAPDAYDRARCLLFSLLCGAGTAWETRLRGRATGTNTGRAWCGQKSAWRGGVDGPATDLALR